MLLKRWWIAPLSISALEVVPDYTETGIGIYFFRNDYLKKEKYMQTYLVNRAKVRKRGFYQNLIFSKTLDPISFYLNNYPVNIFLWLFWKDYFPFSQKLTDHLLVDEIWHIYGIEGLENEKKIVEKNFQRMVERYKFFSKFQSEGIDAKEISNSLLLEIKKKLPSFLRELFW
jgi:hypothetical protein